MKKKLVFIFKRINGKEVLQFDAEHYKAKTKQKESKKALQSK